MAQRSDRPDLVDRRDPARTWIAGRRHRLALLPLCSPASSQILADPAAAPKDIAPPKDNPLHSKLSSRTRKSVEEIMEEIMGTVMKEIMEEIMETVMEEIMEKIMGTVMKEIMELVMNMITISMFLINFIISHGQLYMFQHYSL